MKNSLSYLLCSKKSNFRKSFLLTFLFLILTSIVTFATTKTSTGNGNWGAAGSWSPSGRPVAGDDVVIAAGHTITLNRNTPNLASLTINGTLTIGNNNTDRNVTVSGNVIINSGGVFNTAGNGGNSLNIAGNLTNDGTFDMLISSATADVTFDGAANQMISGSGGTTDFNNIIINNTGSSSDNIVEVNSSNFTATSGFLTLTKGILKMSGNYMFSNTFFSTANPTIDADEGLWLNNANVIVIGQNGDTRLDGLLRISDGTYNVGVGADWWLYYNSGAELIIEGGALNVSGAFFGSTTSSTISFTQSGGIMTVNTAGNTYNVASFEIWATGSTFAKSGGSLIMQRPATAFTDYINYSTNSSITGGEIQAGNMSTPSGSVFWMASTPPVYNLEVYSTNTPNFQFRSNTTVLNDVIINGVLDAASQNVDITVGRNWINNGSFLPGTAKVTFNGTVAQSIGGSSSTSFNKLELNNTGGDITLNNAIDIIDSCIFSAGILNASSTNLITFNDNAVASGANNGTFPSYVNGPVKKVGDDEFIFPVGKIGAGYHYCAISAPSSSTDVFTAEYMRASATVLGTITAAGLSHVSNCEYWNIERSTGLSAVDVTISWNGNSNCNGATYVNDLSTLTIAHFDGTNWDTHGKNSSTGTVSDGSVTWNNVTTFSPFALGSTSSQTNPLPVKFSSVKAWPINNGNKIEWTNATEKDVDHYDVERSENGINFVTVLTAFAKNNFGGKTDYSLIDPIVNNGSVFYRIKAVEFQGTKTYSSIVKVSRNINTELNLNLFPNPVINRRLNMQFQNITAGNYYMSVFDMSGRIVFRKGITIPGGNFSQSIQLPESTSKGQYMLIVSGNATNIKKKFLVK